MSVLRTTRLEIRPLRADDLEAVTLLGADARVMAPLGGVRSAEKSEAWLADKLAHTERYGYGRCAIIREGEFIGCVGLSRADFELGIVPGIEVAWFLAFAHWHRGYATEAARAVIDQGFRELDLPEVIAVTAMGNARSRAVMERLGMRYSPEDTFEHPRLSEGDPLRTHVVYRLLRR